MSQVSTVKEATRQALNQEFQFTGRHPEEWQLWSSTKNKYVKRWDLLIWERVQTTNERPSSHGSAMYAADVPRFKRDNTVDERALDAMIDQAICSIFRELCDTLPPHQEAVAAS